MKKILIISQTIYPAQYPRSFRATELAKELGRQGHEVILYGVLGNYNYSSFENENPNIRVKNIGKMRFAKINSDSTYRLTLLDRGLKRILGKILDFPDIEFTFKITKVLKREHNIDCLITVGMPFPIHWGAALYKFIKKTNFPKRWIADCGDPYMGNLFTKRLFYFKYIEKWFCKKADFLTIPIEGAKEGYYKEFHNKIAIIPQGFNFNEFNFDNSEPKNKVITFVYAGVFYKGIRDPQLLLEYLSTLDLDFKFVVYTKTKDLLQPYSSVLKDKLEIRDYIPRQDLLKVMNRADFLINIENGTTIHSPSKLIDYIIAKRPILSIYSHKLDQDKILAFLNKDFSSQLVINDVEQYKIENVAKSFLELCL